MSLQRFSRLAALISQSFLENVNFHKVGPRIVQELNSDLCVNLKTVFVCGGRVRGRAVDSEGVSLLCSLLKFGSRGKTFNLFNKIIIETINVSKV